MKVIILGLYIFRAFLWKQPWSQWSLHAPVYFNTIDRSMAQSAFNCNAPFILNDFSDRIIWTKFDVNIKSISLPHAFDRLFSRNLHFTCTELSIMYTLLLSKRERDRKIEGILMCNTHVVVMTTLNLSPKNDMHSLTGANTP